MATKIQRLNIDLEDVSVNLRKGKNATYHLSLNKGRGYITEKGINYLNLKDGDGVVFKKSPQDDYFMMLLDRDKVKDTENVIELRVKEKDAYRSMTFPSTFLINSGLKPGHYNWGEPVKIGKFTYYPLVLLKAKAPKITL